MTGQRSYTSKAGRTLGGKLESSHLTYRLGLKISSSFVEQKAQSQVYKANEEGPVNNRSIQQFSAFEDRRHRHLDTYLIPHLKQPILPPPTTKWSNS